MCIFVKHHRCQSVDRRFQESVIEERIGISIETISLISSGKGAAWLI